MSSTVTILLVEDEPAVKGLFAQALRREGDTVYEARHLRAKQDDLKVI